MTTSNKPLIKVRNKYGFVIAIAELDEQMTIEIPNCRPKDSDYQDQYYVEPLTVGGSYIIGILEKEE